MWDQYAAQHKGVCLIFNFEKLKAAFHEQYKNHTYTYESMRYIDRPLYDTQESPAFIINIDYLEKMGPKDYALAHIVKHRNRMFFEKAKDWENESEFRFMIFECKQEEYFLDYKDSLQGIVFGESCSEQDISRVVSLTESKAIQYQKLLWRNCTPWFDFSRNVWK